MSCRFVSRRVREPRVRVLILEKHNKGRSTIDIEHVPVPDDPRAWSYARKVRHQVFASSSFLTKDMLDINPRDCVLRVDDR